MYSQSPVRSISWNRLIYTSVYVQTSLLDLKEHASSLASSGLKKDSKLKSMEIAFEHKREELLKVENHLKRVSFSARHDATKCLPTVINTWSVI